MKKLLLMAALAFSGIGMQAQQTLTLSTYKGTDLAQYAGKTLNVSVNRYLFNGWNTVSLPFSMTAAQVDETFGSDCKLEKLIGVENDGQNIKLNFQDCKAEGIKANTPYILYYSGQTGSKKFTVENVAVVDAPASVTYTAEGTGETVTMACAKQQQKSEGLYGIWAKDNVEAAFVNVDGAENGFFATRCYVQLASGNATLLTTNHVSNDVSSIKSVVKPGEQVDVYNLSGVKVANSVENLQKGIYVVKGKKVLVQ